MLQNLERSDYGVVSAKQGGQRAVIVDGRNIHLHRKSFNTTELSEESNVWEKPGQVDNPPENLEITMKTW